MTEGGCVGGSLPKLRCCDTATGEQLRSGGDGREGKGSYIGLWRCPGRGWLEVKRWFWEYNFAFVKDYISFLAAFRKRTYQFYTNEIVMAIR